MHAIELHDLAKSYQTKTALNLQAPLNNLEIDKGELFGIIGPDGAGKTTLFRILNTLILADRGSARVDGFDVVKDYKTIRTRVGYMPGRFSLYQDLTVVENLRFFASIFGTTIQENYAQVEEIYKQIEPFKNRRAGKLSGGMKQKLALSCALIHRPSVLFLDEPTTGVDPVSRREFWQMLKRLQNEGITILVSTPYMDEALLCDRIALFDKGAFLQIDSPQNMRKRYDKMLFAISSDNMPKLLADIRTLPEVERCFAFGDVHHATVDESQVTDVATFINNIKQELAAKGNENIDVNLIEASIEDCFMALNK